MPVPSIFLALLAIPWLSALAIAVIPKKIQVNTSIVLAGIFTYLAFKIGHIPEQIIAYPWFTLGGKSIEASFWINSSAQLLLLLVSVVALFVQIFSKSYLAKDPHIGRYYCYLHLFIGSMTLLVLTDQVYLFYGGWELVGACSYLLISFWHQKDSAIKAAKKAFLLNRIGDIALLLGLVGLSNYFGTTSFSNMHGTAPALIGIAIIIGGIGKSAQFPLMSWLPDAMEGPTPASALIHAATMVAAGVFVGIRIFPFVGEETHLFMGAIGAISLVSGAFFALFQNDIKKALAYSTISQLGLMWLGMGSGASLFHLYVHGIFKAGLFLTAGSVIHFLHNQKATHHHDAQSLTHMGGLRKQLPLSFAAYLIFGAGLMGIPLTSGFYSKENIAGYLWVSAQNSAFSSYYYVLLGALALGMALTATYICRQTYLIFLGQNRAGHHFEKSSTNWLQLIPISLLIFLSLFFWISVNPIDAHHSVFLSFFHIENYHIPEFWLAITAGTWVIGILATALTRQWIPAKNYQFAGFIWPKIYQFALWIGRKTHVFDVRILDRLLVKLSELQVIIAHLSAWIDRHLVDGLVEGIASISQALGARLRTWQSAQVQKYWIWVIITLVFILLYLLY
jgi:NADH-quinone oxidoreductase subunit L